jgi:hypothetical protein
MSHDWCQWWRYFLCAGEAFHPISEFAFINIFSILKWPTLDRSDLIWAELNLNLNLSCHKIMREWESSPFSLFDLGQQRENQHCQKHNWGSEWIKMIKTLLPNAWMTGTLTSQNVIRYWNADFKKFTIPYSNNRDAMPQQSHRVFKWTWFRCIVLMDLALQT